MFGVHYVIWNGRIRHIIYYDKHMFSGFFGNSDNINILLRTKNDFHKFIIINKQEIRYKCAYFYGLSYNMKRVVFYSGSYVGICSTFNILDIENVKIRGSIILGIIAYNDQFTAIWVKNSDRLVIYTDDDDAPLLLTLIHCV